MKISEPTLLINRNQVEKNIDNMIKRAKKFDAEFRPHFKTHQSIETGEIFKKKGVSKITVSSVSMARYFAYAAWNDITIAFPANLREADKINILAGKIRLNILVDSLFVMNSLSKYITHSLGVFIKIDVGYHRCGLDFKSEETEKIIGSINKNKYLTFKGFLTHAGQNYNAKGKVEIEKNVGSAIDRFKFLKQKFPDALISWGDTPSCSLSDNLDYFDELRPGNFVYYDVMQYHIGSCKMEDIAVALACPIVSTNKGRNELVIFGGAVHFSKEFIEGDNNFKLYGYVVRIENGEWGNPIPGAYLSSLSQEHGIIKMPPKLINEFNPGDIIGILPIHSCLSAKLLKNNTIIV